MAQKRTAKAVVMQPDVITVKVTGLCRACKHWKSNDKLRGYWVGTCAKGTTQWAAETFTCEKWEAKK
jgi:hypothetical protein